MSYKEKLRPASLDKVPFGVKSASFSTGKLTTSKRKSILRQTNTSRNWK